MRPSAGLTRKNRDLPNSNSQGPYAEKAIVLRDNSTMYYLRFVISRQLRASARWPAIARMLNLSA
jgi:hypothetical protein